MFSADWRRAVAAEAAGEYTEAARAYALCGEHAKVAEMHLLRAERAPSAEAKLQELRAALRWADPDEVEGKAVRRRIARGLHQWAKQAGVVSDDDRQVLRQAAALYAEVGDHAGAGQALELAGDESAAAEAYQRAGELERLEAILAKDETRRKRTHLLADAFEEHRLRLASGERDRAVAALRLCVEESRGGDQVGYRRQLEALEARLITEGAVALRTDGRETRYVGVFPLLIGREALCHLVLRDAGVSRRHLEVLAEGDGFQVRDLGSRNGTTLSGLPIAGTLPLPQEGVLGVGEHVDLAFQSAGPARLAFTVARGLDRGLGIVASPRPLPLGELAELRWESGRPFVAAQPGTTLLLDGVQAGQPVQLLHGDVVELTRAGARLELEVL
jgi:tetratricopeptide (TPR) repeat protein